MFAVPYLMLSAVLLMSPEAPRASDDLGPLLVVYPVIDIDPRAGESLLLDQIARVVDTTTPKPPNPLTEFELTLPNFGDRSSVSLGEVRLWLNSIAELQQFEVLGPERIRLQAAVSEGQVAEVIAAGAQALHQQVSSRWSEEYRGLQYRFLGKPDELRIYDDTTWEVNASHLATLGRRVSVRLTIERNGALQTLTLWYGVSGEVRAWRAVDDLDLHQPVPPELFRLGWVSLSHRDAQRLAQPHSGHRLTVGMRAGNVLTTQVTEPIPAVEYGQAVSVRVSAPGLQVTTMATAQQTAAIGDAVKVASQSTDEIFEALVVAPGIVEIIPGLPYRRVH